MLLTSVITRIAGSWPSPVVSLPWSWLLALSAGALCGFACGVTERGRTVPVSRTRVPDCVSQPALFSNAGSLCLLKIKDLCSETVTARLLEELKLPLTLRNGREGRNIASSTDLFAKCVCCHRKHCELSRGVSVLFLSIFLSKSFHSSERGSSSCYD